MKKSRNLTPFSDPPPPPPTACKACGTFRAECLVPVEEAAVPMCWLCAHHVVEHDVSVQLAHSAECECCPHEIYPNRDAPIVAPKPEAPKETRSVREVERDKLLSASASEQKAWIVEAHKQMSVSQHAAVKKRLN